MAKIVRFNSSLSSPEWGVCQTYLREGEEYFVDGEKCITDLGNIVTYSLSPINKAKRNFGVEFNSRWFTVVENTFKKGNIGVSAVEPEVGKPLKYKLIEPIENCTSLNRKFGITDSKFDEYWISDVEYIGDHLFFVATGLDSYYILAKNLSFKPNKEKIRLAVANDGIPPKPGEFSKTLSQVVWAQYGCMILNSTNVVVKSWIRISEHVYKAIGQDAQYYVLAWYI